MSPESPGNLVALDLQWSGSRLECQVDRYDPLPRAASEFLYVSWNALECPEHYVPLAKGVAYVWVPPHFVHRQYRARVDVAGDGHEWIDKETGLGLMLILTLPRDHSYVFPHADAPGPFPVRFKPTADGRMALYWWLKGNQSDGRSVISWRMARSAEIDLEARCDLLNEESRRMTRSSAYPVHLERAPHAGHPHSWQPSVLHAPPDWHVGVAIIAERLVMDRSTHITNQVTNSPGAIANVAQYMSDVTSSVTQQVDGCAASDDIKELVKELAERIAAIDSSVGPEQAKQMARDLKTLSEEMAKSQPRRKWYELSLEGIKEAAVAIGEIGKPIVETVTRLTPLLVP